MRNAAVPGFRCSAALLVDCEARESQALETRDAGWVSAGIT